MTQVLGTSTDDDGVKVVQVAVVRRTGTRCKQLAARATFVTSSCRKPTGFLTATGKRAWRLVLPRVLSHGVYALLVRVTDTAGQQTVRAPRSVRIR